MTHENFLPIPVFDKSEPIYIRLAGDSHCDGTFRVVNKKSGLATFEYIISGYGNIVKENGDVLHPKTGDTFFIPEHEYHDYSSSADDPWVKIWIGVSGPLVDYLIDAYSLRNQNIYHCNTEPYLKRIHQALTDEGLTAHEIANKAAIIFHEMIQFIALYREVREPVCPDALTLKNYIDIHLYQQITIEELAGLISKSTAHTIRIFKDAYSVTPYKYCIDNRIKKAKELLRSTSSTVKGIAFMLGFCDEHYFTNLFKEKTGKTPSQYRNQR